MGAVAVGTVLIPVLLVSGQIGNETGGLAGYVPADVALFAEVHQLKQLRRTAEFLAVRRLIDTAAELRAPGESALREWEEAIERIFAAEPLAALDTYFGQRAAVASPALGNDPFLEAVLIARVARAETLMQMLSRTRARFLGARKGVRIYYLPNAKMRAAVRTDLLILGPGSDARQRIFNRVVALAADPNGAGSLARNRSFRELQDKLPAGAEAILYVNQSRRSRRRPAATEPLVGLNLGRSEWYGAGLYRRAGHLRVDLRVRYGTKLHEWPAAGRRPELLAAQLPRDVLGAWAYRFDPAGLVARLERDPRAGGPAALLLSKLDALLPGRDLKRDVLPYFSQVGCTFLIKLAGPADYPVPAVGIIVEVSDAAAIGSAVEQAARSLGTMLAVSNVEAGELRTFTLEDLPNEKPVIHYLPIGRGLAALKLPFLGELELAWAMPGDALIVATHHLAVRQVVLARSGESEALGPLGGSHPDGTVLELVMVEPGRISWMVRQLLGYLRGHRPEYFGAGRGEQAAVEVGSDLGIEAKAAGTIPGVVTVRSVRPGSPADGILAPDDQIKGLSGGSLAQEEPFVDLVRRVGKLRGQTAVRLCVVRHGREMELSVPLPAARPQPAAEPHQAIRVLRRISSALAPFGRVCYYLGTDGPSDLWATVDLPVSNWP